MTHDPAEKSTPARHPAADWQRYTSQLRAARERLQNLTVDDPAIPACISGLNRIEDMLRRPLRLVVLGEYNSGKTSVTGLILGKGLLPVNVLSNTGIPVHIGHGAEPALYGIDQNGISIRIDGADDDPLTDLAYQAIDIRLPLPWLQTHQILDTPATMTPALYAADADIVLWCTVATRAWTESERNLWSAMPPRVQKNAILVATHKDSFYSDEDCDQVLRRLHDMTAGLFRRVVLVSASASASPNTFDAPDGTPDDTQALHTAIESAAGSIRARRFAKAQRIVQRLSRLALHEFGRNAIRPDSARLFTHWYALSDRILDGHRAGQLTIDQALRAVLSAFAQIAESLQPGVIAPAGPSAHINGQTHATSRSDGAFTNPTALRADLTAVLRMLATASRYESPQTREQREAARATLIALADLDTILKHIGDWLTAQPAISAPRTPNVSA